MSEENWSCLVTIFLFKKRLPVVFGISITRLFHAHFSIVVPLDIWDPFISMRYFKNDFIAKKIINHITYVHTHWISEVTYSGTIKTTEVYVNANQ